MKAVIYHADGPVAANFEPDLYRILFDSFKASAKQHNIETIHLTVHGHPAWADNTFFIDGDANDIVYNREVAWLEFLKQADHNEVYWFTEPDSRIYRMWPELSGDLALTRRMGDPVPICPAWRMATTKSIPIFEEILDYFDLEQKTWHGDSVAFTKLWHAMGQPGIEDFCYRNINIELRNYKQYLMTKSKFSRQFKGQNKITLFNQEHTEN